MKTTTNQQRIEAIILKNTPYKENDVIAHIYSLEYGKISVMVKGARKLTSKTASGCSPITNSYLDIILKKGISTLIRSEVSQYYRQIKENIDSEIIANVILEYYYRYVEENQPSLEQFQFLKTSLEALNNGNSVLGVYLFFLSHVLKHEGVELEVNKCIHCDDKKVVSISLNGGFVCYEHRGSLPLMEVQVLKAFRHLNKLSINDIDKFHYDDVFLKELIPFFDYYIEEYAGIQFKSKVFVDSLFKGI